MKMADAKAGFTLIELMVVVIIIAALASMVLPRVIPASDQAKAKIARGDMANIAVALKLYRLQNDEYPGDLGAITEKYLERDPIDPWGNRYEYKTPGEAQNHPFDLWSWGIDRKNGSSDDIKHWDTGRTTE
ncbi:MAG: type II secretion system protein GspG [Verrucomicrobia bacterium]|nr:type II secretion system protein GspG [Verrucomicrobiota bacterium]